MTQPGNSVSTGECTLPAGSPAVVLLVPTHRHKDAATEAATKPLALTEELSHATMPGDSEG